MSVIELPKLESAPQIEEILNKLVCPGWDDNHGCNLSNNCSSCKDSARRKNEEYSHVLQKAGFVQEEQLARELFDSLVRFLTAAGQDTMAVEVYFTEYFSVLADRYKKQEGEKSANARSST